MSARTTPDVRDQTLAELIDEAFNRYGAAALWSCKKPAIATPEAAAAIGRHLVAQGGRDAYLLGRILLERATREASKRP